MSKMWTISSLFASRNTAMATKLIGQESIDEAGFQHVREERET